MEVHPELANRVGAKAVARAVHPHPVQADGTRASILRSITLVSSPPSRSRRMIKDVPRWPGTSDPLDKRSAYLLHVALIEPHDHAVVEGHVVDLPHQTSQLPQIESRSWCGEPVRISDNVFERNLLYHLTVFIGHFRTLGITSA